MSEAEYAILDHLESVCRELRAMIRTTEKGALQDVQLGDLVSCLYTALDSAVVVCDEYQSRAEAASLERGICRRARPERRKRRHWRAGAEGRKRRHR